MYSEGQIDKKIKPLVDIQLEIEGVVLSTIAKKLKEAKSKTPSDIHKLAILSESNAIVKEMLSKISLLSKKSQLLINNIITDVAEDSYKDSEELYKYTNTPYKSFNDNTDIQEKLKEIKKKSIDDYKYLLYHLIFVMQDSSNSKLKHKVPLKKVYPSTLDIILFYLLMGMDKYDNPTTKVIKQLVDSGLKTVDTQSEDIDNANYSRLDSVVRRDILNEIKSTQQTVHDITGKQFGADGIELSVHQYSAPDHEPVQGHQFTNEEYEKLQTGQDFEDVNGIKFRGFARPIGAYNCRHFAWGIVIGHKTPNYSLKELEEIKKNNANGFTYTDKDGKKVTKSMYWCTQKQRNYELRLRKLDEIRKMANLAQEFEVENQYTNKFNSLLKGYTIFSNKCGLTPKFDRIHAML